MTANLLRVEYAQTGKSSQTNEMGMREMQARAFHARHQPYILIKAPPASGKSRALMFLALDKLTHQGRRKAIIAVPDRSIGNSFRNVALSRQGFFADWNVRPENNLCTIGSDSGKVDAFVRFLEAPVTEFADRILVCTHSTLRLAYDRLGAQAFSDCVLAVDEFHHVSVDQDNRLGALVDGLMQNANTHIVAMTGSYFRGDTVPILLPEDEARFTKVSYTYYEQLNGYRHLKSLGIGYHIYQGRYINAVREVLDTDLKTIIHIPSVSSAESTTDKYSEVDAIIDVIGTVHHQDPETGLVHVTRADGTRVKVANLVEDSIQHRSRIVNFLRSVEHPEDLDIIIALGMAKEGFDWPYCEHVLTIGYRRSMTEVVQIIGRATRDAPGKTHAQFTNLIAQPDAEDEDVKNAVNNMLKAITVSLLMEQVLAPSFQFRPRKRGDDALIEPGVIRVGEEGGPPPSQRVLDTLNGNGADIIAELYQKPSVGSAAFDPGLDHRFASQVELPKIIQERHPELSEEEVEQVRAGLQTQMALNALGGLIPEDEVPPEKRPQKRKRPTPDSIPRKDQFVKMGNQFINIEDLSIDLIDAINPFRGAFEILSRHVTAPVLKSIQDVITARRVKISEREAVMLWPQVKAFHQDSGREPSIHSHEPAEVRLAEALHFLRHKKREREKLRAETARTGT